MCIVLMNARYGIGWEIELGTTSLRLEGALMLAFPDSTVTLLGAASVDNCATLGPLHL